MSKSKFDKEFDDACKRLESLFDREKEASQQLQDTYKDICEALASTDWQGKIEPLHLKILSNHVSMLECRLSFEMGQIHALKAMIETSMKICGHLARLREMQHVPDSCDA